MWFIYISLCIGILIGATNIVPKKILKHYELISLFCIFTLLFVMGINIGLNKEVIKNIGKVGYAGFIYALFTVIFSILIVHLFTRVKKK